MQEWKAYAQLEPWGEMRADYRAGIVSSLIYNMNRSKKSAPRGPEEFMPYLKAEKQREHRLRHKREDPKGIKLSKRIREIFKKGEA